LDVYPNPLNTKGTITFSLEYSSHVFIRLMTLDGKFISTIATLDLEPGLQQIDFDGEPLSKGVYLIQLQTDTEILTKKDSCSVVKNCWEEKRS
jgi:hypothetical protein